MCLLQDFLVTAKSLQGGLDIGRIMSSNSQDCYSCVNINWVYFTALCIYCSYCLIQNYSVILPVELCSIKGEEYAYKVENKCMDRNGLIASLLFVI